MTTSHQHLHTDLRTSPDPAKETFMLPRRQQSSTTYRHHQPPAGRPGVSAAILVAGLIALTGCATGGEDNWNSTAVGDDKSVGALDLRSVLLVAAEDGGPARLLGTLENNTDQPIEVTISDEDEETTLTVPGDGSIGLDTDETLLQSAGDAPGARTTLTATTDEGDVELLVPVVDGTLDPYEPYLPE
ncbi:hypothetical protein IWX63_001860 [Arthrobacter sp. CAN_A2]|uniref:hypothetical protein n=1 Tax=Arthrobacter sp. CAN_A2 TaxID=2787718 RepID=UPI0018F0016C